MSLRLVVTLLLGLLAGQVEAAPLSIQDAFATPLLSELQISPDGRTLLAVAYSGSNGAAVMIDIESMRATPVKGFLPARSRWLPDGTAAIAGLPDSTAIVAADGKVLSVVDGMLVRRLRPAPDGANRILVRRWRNPDAYVRVNLRTGERVLAHNDLPSGQVNWLLFDADGVARVATVSSSAFWSDATEIAHWYRPHEQARWEKLAGFSAVEDRWNPVQLTQDGKALLVQSRQGRDTYAYFRYEIAERRMGAIVAEHPRHDVGLASFGADEQVQFLVGDGMKPDLLWSDPAWAELQRLVDQALPERTNRLQGDPKGLVLVRSEGDVDPGRWLLLDVRKSQLRDLFESKPEVDPARMFRKQIVSYRSSDGLEIPAYLTLPAPGAGPGKAVVLVHGGPVHRDRWDWDPEVQLLASRGYAVLQPQFRGSSGLGRRFMDAGRHQWGLAMQDDVSAGARWLASQGHADAGRICIVGASYGGYAALWALAKTPDLFRCGVSLAAITDLELRLDDDSDVNQTKFGRLWQRDFIGDPKLHRQRLTEVSPLLNVERIKAPVLIAHGDLDERVPIRHSELMVEALRRHRKNFEWIELKGEGHGVSGPANQQRYYGAMLDFLERHIGSSIEAAATLPAAP